MNYTAPLLICIATAWLGWNAAGAEELRALSDVLPLARRSVVYPEPASGRRKPDSGPQASGTLAQSNMTRPGGIPVSLPGSPERRAFDSDRVTRDTVSLIEGPRRPFWYIEKYVTVGPGNSVSTCQVTAGNRPATLLKSAQALMNGTPRDASRYQASTSTDGVATGTGRAGGRPATSFGTPELHLARTCELEAGGFPRDCAAIYWVAVRRATLPWFQGKGWVHAMLQYSRLYKRRNARARSIARLPFGTLPDATRWEQLMRLSERIVAGEVPDPCRFDPQRRKAMHWRGPMDPYRDNLVPVRCGRTRNQFLAYRKAK